MRRTGLGAALTLSLLVLAGVSAAQDAEQAIAPETRIELGEPSGLATPLGPPVTVPVTLVIGCHPDESSETTTRVHFQVEPTDSALQTLISPSTVSYTPATGECPDPGRERRVEATLVVRSGRGPAFTTFPVHVAATVTREVGQETTWRHGPYHANATIERGFAPAANVTTDPSMVQAGAGSTATTQATIENLSNGPARITLGVRVDGPGAFSTRTDPEIVELLPGATTTVRVQVTDDRDRLLSRQLSAKVLAHVSSTDPRPTPDVTEQGTLRIHFDGEIERADPPFEAPSLGSLIPVVLLAAAALLVSMRTGRYGR